MKWEDIQVSYRLITVWLATASLFSLYPHAALAASSSTTVSATITSPGFCLVFTPTTTLNFGNLDPSNPVDVNVSTTITIWCLRFGAPTVTYFAGDDDGLHETGLNANRMQHTGTPTEYLPYAMSVVPQSATIPRFTVTTLTINGTVLGADYQTALIGDYSDTVTVQITP